MTNWTPEEIQQLADLVADRVAARMPKHVCAFDEADQVTLRAWARGTRRVQSTALATFVGAAVLGVLTLIGAGVIAWVRERLNGR